MDINNIIPTIHLSNVRASARIRAKKEIRPSNSIVPPVRKKQKIKSLAEPELVLPKPPARVRGRRGLLKNITEMPLDVLFEIFGHLEPQDVLHVSQANKALHSILKAPSANAIWVSVSESTLTSLIEFIFTHVFRRCQSLNHVHLPVQRT